jgi:hypothetical protein
MVRTTNPSKIINMIKICPFFLNGFVTTGKENLILLLAGEDLSSLQSIIDNRIRSDIDVQSADFNIMISSSNDFVMPLNLIDTPLNKSPCGLNHDNCKADKKNCCFGCPAISNYKGVFW